MLNKYGEWRYNKAVSMRKGPYKVKKCKDDEDLAFWIFSFIAIFVVVLMCMMALFGIEWSHGNK